jgi:hypothetical protein
MKTFCCNAFRFHYETKNQMGLNIRVIKIDPKYMMPGSKNYSLYRVFISEGYDLFNDSTQRSLINFCPYCGEKLIKYYAFDEFVNEIDN